MLLYLRQEGKLGTVIDLTGLIGWLNTEKLEVYIRLFHGTYTIKFEATNDVRHFFKSLVSSLKNQTAFLDTQEAGMKFVTFNYGPNAVPVINPSNLGLANNLSVIVENKDW